ncbi:hypothetical protein O181_122321 [Austropuccinia psidii MF-1]|uniref:Uncharacterized protein n=1 Tax=Austropuccinia psidii MF-1 TaxID=1389203 RepID=A0A9Q3Q288_9BASI|nr:hypothetical protein [Austropuccinia psidii MF-1]
MTPALETQAPVASNSSISVQGQAKGPQKKIRGRKNHQGKGKGKANWHRPYPQGYSIPKLEPSAVDMITKWANNSWSFKIENAFENSIYNPERDKPLTCFFKKKDRLSDLHPDMSDNMIKMRILRKCVGELDYDIKGRCVEPCSTEDYINAMEDVISRTRIGKTWTKIPM